MHCKKCRDKLEIARSCRKIRMRCTGCGAEFQIHEVADQLDEETEKKLESFTSIIYD